MCSERFDHIFSDTRNLNISFFPRKIFRGRKLLIFFSFHFHSSISYIYLGSNYQLRPDLQGRYILHEDNDVSHCTHSGHCHRRRQNFFLHDHLLNNFLPRNSQVKRSPYADYFLLDVTSYNTIKTNRLNPFPRPTFLESISKIF